MSDDELIWVVITVLAACLRDRTLKVGVDDRPVRPGKRWEHPGYVRQWQIAVEVSPFADEPLGPLHPGEFARRLAALIIKLIRIIRGEVSPW
ncbi:hypothetical protein [Nocardia abscessus]|uniref:hypothetical protein n=1 Tax=Nocardia abscessus TaxID=120957 RepID=UPI0024564929|nr:hypothetical protein [Nocardia abscessus]